MYIHGGYWRSLDKKRFSFVAPPLVKAGITVAVPDYGLARGASRRHRDADGSGLRVAVP